MNDIEEDIKKALSNISKDLRYILVVSPAQMFTAHRLVASTEHRFNDVKNVKYIADPYICSADYWQLTTVDQYISELKSNISKHQEILEELKDE